MAKIVQFCNQTILFSCVAWMFEMFLTVTTGASKFTGKKIMKRLRHKILHLWCWHENKSYLLHSTATCKTKVWEVFIKEQIWNKVSGFVDFLKDIWAKKKRIVNRFFAKKMWSKRKFGCCFEVLFYYLSFCGQHYSVLSLILFNLNLFSAFVLLSLFLFHFSYLPQSVKNKKKTRFVHLYRMKTFKMEKKISFQRK